jgi:predicted nucleotidyltransferase
MSRNTIISAVRHALSRVDGAIYLFGSAIYTTTSNSDVDLIIVTQKRSIRRELDRAKRLFRKRFRRRLHVQLFHPYQIGEILRFFKRCGPRIRCL